MCNECEEEYAEVHCSECSQYQCSSCSQTIHSLKKRSLHKPIDYHSSPVVSHSLPPSSSIIQYYQCELHNKEDMKLYCIACSLFICGECLDESHSKHEVITVKKYVERVKEEWMDNVERVKEEHPALIHLIQSI